MCGDTKQDEEPHGEEAAEERAGQQQGMGVTRREVGALELLHLLQEECMVSVSPKRTDARGKAATLVVGGAIVITVSLPMC
jgi:hypothetical protein